MLRDARTASHFYEYDTARFVELGGMARLKQGLSQRKAAFDGTATQLDPPKGVLLLGVQGCGKSVAARAAAGIYGMPLLRLSVQLTEAHVRQLAQACTGFSGAEIEQAVVSAVYSAHARGDNIDASHVLHAINSTRPLSVVTAEKVAELRAWAAQRTVPAD